MQPRQKKELINKLVKYPNKSFYPTVNTHQIENEISERKVMVEKLSHNKDKIQ